MRFLLVALLCALSYAQTEECGCVKSWEFKGMIYHGCDSRAPKDKKPWCYVEGDTCKDAKESTVKSGEFWRYCTETTHIAAASTAVHVSNQGADGPSTVTHMVVVSKGAPPAEEGPMLPNPNEAPAAPLAPAAPMNEDSRGANAQGDDGHENFKPLHKTMSEGRLLRKLWAEMNQIESLIHAANVDLKARLIKAFKVVRTRMVEWERMKDDNSGKKTEGQRLRAMWAAMGAIEDEIHEINIAMKKRLQGLIQALRAKMHIFDAAAERIDRMRQAEGKPAGVVPASASAAMAGSALPMPASSGPCPPGEVAIAGEGGVACSAAGTNPNEMSVSNVPAWRRHLQEDELSSMAPLVKTVSEGAKLRALWAELGGIEKEIHETNLVLKARLLAAFKVIRARMANWEKEGNSDKRKSEGAKLRAQWAELGKVEEQIHITNQEMKRRLRRVIRVIKEKMHHFEVGADEVQGLANKQNPNKPGRSHKKLSALSDSLE